MPAARATPPGLWPLATTSLALLLFALFDIPAIAAFVPAYLLAWLAIELGARRGLARVPRSMFALIAAISIAVIAARSRELAETDQLAGLGDLLSDRARIEQRPSIAPPLVSAAEPQVFYIHAPGAPDVSVRFGDRAIAAEDLRHGLFRLAYDPRRDGPPIPGDGPLIAELIAGGRSHPRPMQAVTPLPHPRAFCSSPALGIAAAPSEETDQLFLIDRSGRVRTATTADGPVACAILEDRAQIAVVHRFAAELALFDYPKGQLIKKLEAPAPATGIARLDQDTLAIAVEDPPALASLNLDTGELRSRPLSFTPDHLLPNQAIAGRDTRALHAWDRDTRLDFGRPIVALATHGARAFAAVTDYRPDRSPGPNHHVADQIVMIDLDRRRVLASQPSGCASPMQLVALDDHRVTAACAGTDELATIDLLSGEVSRTKLPLARPYGLAALGDQLYAVSYPALGTIALAGPAAIASPVANDHAAARRRGELAFWEATTSGASCQTCHRDADTDHSLHDIGQPTPRPTLTVRGIARTAPYLRGASYDSIGALEHFAATILGGYATDDHQARAEALEAYLGALPGRSPRRLQPLERARRGVDAFVTARCPECHAFPAFTTLAQYPSRFLFPAREEGELELLDVPSLLGARSRAPYYLHDGAASSLDQLLTDPALTERHGELRALNREERAYLLEFLESL